MLAEAIEANHFVLAATSLADPLTEQTECCADASSLRAQTGRNARVRETALFDPLGTALPRLTPSTRGCVAAMARLEFVLKSDDVAIPSPVVFRTSLAARQAQCK